MDHLKSNIKQTWCIILLWWQEYEASSNEGPRKNDNCFLLSTVAQVSNVSYGSLLDCTVYDDCSVKILPVYIFLSFFFWNFICSFFTHFVHIYCVFFLYQIILSWGKKMQHLLPCLSWYPKPNLLTYLAAVLIWYLDGVISLFPGLNLVIYFPF